MQLVNKPESAGGSLSSAEELFFLVCLQFKLCSKSKFIWSVPLALGNQNSCLAAVAVGAYLTIAVGVWVIIDI